MEAKKIARVRARERKMRESEIDKTFMPLSRELRAFRKRAHSAGAKSVTLCVASPQSGAVRYTLDIFAEGHEAENLRMTERLFKSLLWCVGGGETYVAGDRALGEAIAEIYSERGARAFDAQIMAQVFGSFSVKVCEVCDLPETRPAQHRIGGNVRGCRIGLDAGATNLKVCATEEGRVRFSDSFPWKPRAQSDPAYHFEKVCACVGRAAEFLPRVDAIGVSTAGIPVEGRMMSSSLFTGILDPEKRERAKDLFLDLGKAFGAPVTVANDGDVTALAGGGKGVLGISMGTSEAGGYVAKEGDLRGWISEFAFVPLDLSPAGGVDEWSGDVGCGVNYLSQDGALRLAEKAGLSLSGETPEKFRKLRTLFSEGDTAAREVFRTIGIYLGWALALYAEFYEFGEALLLGGVTVGESGELIRRTAEEVLAEEFPELSQVKLILPTGARGTAQSLAAASL